MVAKQGGKVRCPWAPTPCCLWTGRDGAGMGPQGQRWLRADPYPPGTVLGCHLESTEESEAWRRPHGPCSSGALRPCPQSAGPGEQTTHQQEGPSPCPSDAARASGGPLSSEGSTQAARPRPSCHAQAARPLWACHGFFFPGQRQSQPVRP